MTVTDVAAPPATLTIADPTADGLIYRGLSSKRATRMSSCFTAVRQATQNDLTVNAHRRLCAFNTKQLVYNIIFLYLNQDRRYKALVL